MGGVLAKYNIDLDNVFAYSTVKIVKIRDRRLGILHYACLIGIFIYIVIFTIIINKGYLATEVPVGSVRMSFRRPFANGAPAPTPLENIPYCLPLSQTTTYTYVPADRKNLVTCRPGPGVATVTFENERCEYWDGDEATYPGVEATSITLTTRVTQYSANLTCELDNPNCAFQNDAVQRTIYVADAERFTLLLDHTMIATGRGIQRNSREMTGTLYSRDNNAFIPPPPNQVGVSGKVDILQVSTMLAAAGLFDGLESPSDSDKACDETLRYAGTMILCVITYTNQKTYSAQNVDYELRFYQFPGTDQKSLETIYAGDPRFRLVRNRHGLRILVVQNGLIGSFSFQALLLNMVAGLGLLAVATTVVDVIGTMILPQKKYYSAYKTTTTVDFSDLRNGKTSLPEDVQHQMRMNAQA